MNPICETMPWARGGVKQWPTIDFLHSRQLSLPIILKLITLQSKVIAVFKLLEYRYHTECVQQSCTTIHYRRSA